MDESIVKFLEQPKVGTLKLSEAIRIGCKSVREGRGYGGCALGAAFFALTGEGVQTLPMGVNWATEIGKRFGISADLANKISGLHFDQKMTREQIAHWLEAQGH